jgi:hypothetical protein
MVVHIKKFDGPIEKQYYPIIGRPATFQLAEAIHSGADYDHEKSSFVDSGGTCFRS